MSRLGRLEVAGMTIPVPAGWEARGSAGDVERRARRDEGAQFPYVHLASFPMPATRAAYGGGAVEAMGAWDCFVALVEFTPSSAGTALFAARGVPRRLVADEFSPARLQRRILGQLGCQRFFTASGRALCVYAVLGSAQALRARLTELNEVLSHLVVDRAA